jgi:hypothetical protein
MSLRSLRSRSFVTAAGAALAVALAACGGARAEPDAGAGAGPMASGSGVTSNDTTGAILVPPGFGTLRQDDIAVRLQLTGGLTVRAIPLDESLIRLLSPDSYRALRDLQESRREQISAVQARFRYPRYSIWYVSFFGLEQGEARFSPQELIIASAGRDFRPLEVIPLTSGFGEQRLKQREVQSALYVFDGSIDLAQPLTVTVETAQSTAWANVLQRVERERALVRSRAASSNTRTP